MKKILILLLLVTSFLWAEIDEYKSDVYFANGIATTEETAKKSIEEINLKFKASNPETYKSVKKWDVVYNHTHGIALDLYESLLQKIYEDDVGESLVPVIWNLSELFEYFNYSFKGIVSKIAKKIPKDNIKDYAGTLAKKLAKKTVKVYNKYNKDFTEEEIELMFSEVFDHIIDKGIESYLDKTQEEILEDEAQDVLDHKKAYIQSVKNGLGVVVVAHSQGNLFVNRAYNDLYSPVEATNYKWVQRYFHVLGVASPANNVIGLNSPYITFDNDMIQLVPDSLKTNIINPKRYYFKNAAGEEVETLYSVRAHSFLTSYLATDITRKVILEHISKSVQQHKEAQSQWEGYINRIKHEPQTLGELFRDLECELESLAISMQLFIKILTKISEIQNVVKENKNFLQIIAVLSAYTQKELGFMCES